MNQSLQLNGTSILNTKKSLLNVIMTWFTAVSCPAVLIFNGIIITAIASRRELRTGFNFYIVNIAFADVCAALTSIPGQFLNQYRNHGYLLSPLSCTALVIYGAYVLAAVSRYAHVLLAVNRLWALTFPVSYRQRRTRRFALFLILTSWLLVHAISLPLVVCGRMNALPTEQSCGLDISHQRPYAFAHDMICFCVPLVLVGLIYGFIVMKLISRMRRKSVIPAGNQGNAAVVEAAKFARHRSKERVLLYLVILLVVCWTPAKVYWLMVELNHYWDTTFLAVQFFGQYAHHWLSPILCYLAMDDVRNQVDRMLKCR
ncbi:hypothetical protein BV898_05970 [Hypsibius exemplaris]|uniref:G-protein coupled receptors family 1 profile domain-containing protein n=1 Tax=Hypsibius exemplaris TaxID=2072580 RepID=A0A1W0WXN6_HYPEX|nr:hypothetical protein BV898_05970 [Hypsibius exemplaris]